MNSLVIFRKNARLRSDSSQPSPPKRPMMSDYKLMEPGSLIMPVVTQPRGARKRRSHHAVHPPHTLVTEPAAPIQLVSFVELYRQLCCTDHRLRVPNFTRQTAGVPNFTRENSGAVVDTTPQTYPRVELILEFAYDDPPVPELSAEMRSIHGRDYQHGFM